MILLDTTVLIDVIRGDPAALRWLDELRDLPSCSELTRTEVLRGMRSPERSATSRLLDELEWHPVDRAVSSRAGALGRRYRAGHDLGLVDLVIAATAQVNELPLVTSDVRHFPMFELTAPY